MKPKPGTIWRAIIDCSHHVKVLEFIECTHLPIVIYQDTEHTRVLSHEFFLGAFKPILIKPQPGELWRYMTYPNASVKVQHLGCLIKNADDPIEALVTFTFEPDSIDMVSMRIDDFVIRLEKIHI